LYFVLQLFAVIGPPTFLTFILSAAVVAVIFYVALVLIGRTTVFKLNGRSLRFRFFRELQAKKYNNISKLHHL
jgi:hypothetical protein